MIRALFLRILIFSGVLIATLIFPEIGTADAIVGHWYTEEKEALIDVFENKGLYYGKIIFLSQPLDKDGYPKKDKKNRNPELRDRHQLGLMVLYDLKFNRGKERWEEGKVYIPSLGREANAVVYLENKNALKIRGFVGSESIGRTQIWRRKE